MCAKLASLRIASGVSSLLVVLFIFFGTWTSASPSRLLVGHESSLSVGCCIYSLEDREHRLGLQDVIRKDAEFKLEEGSQSGAELNYGYSPSAYWLRIDLHNPSSTRLERLLEVGYAPLDHVTLFAEGDNGSWLETNTGDYYAFSNRPIPDRFFVFPVSLPAEKTTRIYLRIASMGSVTVPLKLWEADAFTQSSRNVYALLFLYYGVVVSLALYNLMVFVSVRDRAYLYYVWFAASMLFGQITLNGTGYQYLWPESPTWANSAMVISWGMCGFFAARFTSVFLNTAQTLPTLMHRSVIWVGWGWAFAGVSFAFMPYRWSCILISVLGLIHSVTIVLVAMESHRRRQHGARFFLLAWLILLIGTGLTGARNLAVVPTNLLTSYALQVGSALEMLLLSFALADRINRLQREKEEAQAEVMVAQRQALETARKAEMELEQRVRSRTLSLEEANIRLKEQEEALRQMALEDSLTGLANRSLLLSSLQQAILHSQRHGTIAAVMLIDLDYFKEVNDEFGHAAGDVVLKVVAARLRAEVRAADTVARLGGDEFVVVLSDLHEGGEGHLVAEKIVASLSADIDIGEKFVQVGASYGLALYPTDGHTVDELLSAADQSMYKAKRATRSAAT